MIAVLVTPLTDETTTCGKKYFDSRLKNSTTAIAETLCLSQSSRLLDSAPVDLNSQKRRARIMPLYVEGIHSMSGS